LKLLLRFWPLSIAAMGLGAGFWSQSSVPQVLILTGDSDGNLAPCGCTKPMIGGIKRRIQAAKELTVPGHTTLVDNGNLVAGTTRQDEIKAQTIAEILGASGWDAINVGPADARLGIGMLLSLNSLSSGKLISSQMQSSPGVDIRQFTISPPFLIIGVAANTDSIGKPLGQPVQDAEVAIAQGLQQAKDGELTPIMLLQGDHDDAVEFARKFPEIRLIEYRSIGSPPDKPETIGQTALVSPGSEGKYLLRIDYSKGKFSNYSSISLGPQYKDEPNAARLYRGYLSRVSSEHLLEKLPRPDNFEFAGSQTCVACHKAAGKVWSHSLHHEALATLAGRGHDRDPDCLPCHVVGLTSSHGYRSLKLTPGLAGVGCESCHGPGLQHSKTPKLVKLSKVSDNNCVSCHTTNTSPGFSFSAFWKKIRH